MNSRSQRGLLGISQRRLTRPVGVSRFKICTYELGGGGVAPNEQSRIRGVLRAEAERWRDVAMDIDFDKGAACVYPALLITADDQRKILDPRWLKSPDRRWPGEWRDMTAAAPAPVSGAVSVASWAATAEPS
jgi:hypothetical protein